MTALSTPENDFLEGYNLGSTLTRYLILGNLDKVDGERDLVQTLTAIANGELSLTSTGFGNETDRPISADEKSGLANIMHGAQAIERASAERLLKALFRQPGSHVQGSKTD